MKMQIEVDVKGIDEAEAIQRALRDKVTRATVLVIGLLLPLDPETRRTVMDVVVKSVR